MNISYTRELNKLTPENLTGFFNGWQHYPNYETHLKILNNSYIEWLAFAIPGIISDP